MQGGRRLVPTFLLRSTRLSWGIISLPPQTPIHNPAVYDALIHKNISSSLSQFRQHRSISQLVSGLASGSTGARGATGKTQQRSLKVQLFQAISIRSASTVTPSNIEKTGQEVKKWRWSAIFLFLPCAAAFGLGSWQLYRRQWKIEVLDYRRKRLEEEPILLENVISRKTLGAHDGNASAGGIDELEFRRVVREGVYDVEKNLFVGPRATSAMGVTQKGYFVITPLKIVDGGSEQVPVLVNRGWVPSGWRDDEPPFEDPVVTLEEVTSVKKVSRWKFWRKEEKIVVKEEKPVELQRGVTVHGVIRGSEQPNIFVPDNVPSSGEWFYVDVPAMARALGLPENTILIEALQEPNERGGKGEYPIPKDPEALLHTSVMPQDHINYALTWYSLSAATTYMAIRRLQSSRKGR